MVMAVMMMVYKTFVMIMETSAMIQMTMTMMTTKMKPIKMTTWMCNSERPLWRLNIYPSLSLPYSLHDDDDDDDDDNGDRYNDGDEDGH